MTLLFITVSDAVVCLQMREGSADPHGDVGGDQGGLCSVGALVTLVFLDFAPAEDQDW